MALTQQFEAVRVEKIALGVYTEVWQYFDNQNGQPGVNPRALHPTGSTENGKLTDVVAQHPDVVRALDSWLRAWELAHPKVAPTVTSAGPTDRELDQLRAIGYGD